MDNTCYRCETCGTVTVARVLDLGQLPPMLPCLGLDCPGLAPQVLTGLIDTSEPVIEFYRASRAERRRASGEARKWMDSGGLRLRALGSHGEPLGDEEVARLRALMGKTHLPEAQAVRLLIAAAKESRGSVTTDHIP